ncbi:hypothetical protein L3X38_003854 [Prunus dulcis]|uniref:Tf2-1-like SH3-like domain-containing protein n=1 Tax=Prunus dulcis TaxID=3755 RepID=A0AAD4ZMT4_PRUDU|nr:hypothetical protein L3X38_003854 [Prunus dulcis]
MKWMSYLQQFNIVIKYTKGATNKLADMLSSPPTPISSALLVTMKIQHIVPSEYSKGYDTDANFNSAYAKLQAVKKCEFQLMDGLMPFLEVLWGMMDTGLKTSTAFHPQTDGQIEPLSVKEEEEHIRAQKVPERVRKVHTEVEAQLKHSQQRYKARHDKHRVPCNFKEGDLVWLHHGKERLTGEGKQLKTIRYGPFKIIKQIGDNAFQLVLPPYMHIYSVINAQNLKLFEPSLLDNDPNEDTRLPSVDNLKIE